MHMECWRTIKRTRKGGREDVRYRFCAKWRVSNCGRQSRQNRPTNSPVTELRQVLVRLYGAVALATKTTPSCCVHCVHRVAYYSDRRRQQQQQYRFAKCDSLRLASLGHAVVPSPSATSSSVRRTENRCLTNTIHN